MATATTEELRVVFMSKTTYDKRSAANTLLGRKAFDPHGSSLEEKKESVEAPNGGPKITIVDWPALMDLDSSLAEVKKEIDKYRGRLNKYTGFAAIVIVFRYPVRMTPEEIQSVKEILKLLVLIDSSFKNHGILLFTNFQDSEDTFEGYLQNEISTQRQQSTKDYKCLGQLIELVTPERCLFIDTNETDKEKLDVKREEFIKIVQAKKNKLYLGRGYNF